MSNPLSPSDSSGNVLEFALYAARKYGLPAQHEGNSAADDLLVMFQDLVRDAAALPEDHPGSAKSIMARVHFAMKYLANQGADSQGKEDRIRAAIARQLSDTSASAADGDGPKTDHDRLVERLKTILRSPKDDSGALEEPNRAPSTPGVVYNLYAPTTIHLTLGLRHAQD